MAGTNLASVHRAAATALVFALGLVVLAGSTMASEPPPRELAVQISYRLDRELGEIDAAQRHALVARLLVARARNELAPDAAVADVWFEWETRLERLERESGIRHLPAWYWPTVPDAVDAVVGSVRTDQAIQRWQDPLWGDGQPASALRLLTGAGEPDFVLAIQPGALAWARSHAPELWYRLLTWLAAEPEWQAQIGPLLIPWLALPTDASLAEWQALGDQAGAEIEALVSRAGEADGALSRAVDTLVDEALAADRTFGRRPVDEPYRDFLASAEPGWERSMLALARAAYGIEEGRYAEFITVLLAVQGEALDRGIVLEPLIAELDRLDSVLLPWLRRVDPRLINVYQRARQFLRQAPQDPDGLRERRRELAALEAAVSLDTATIGSYLAQPIRDSFGNDQSVCFGLTREPTNAGPAEPITARQFRGCVEAMTGWAVEAAASPSLAGQFGGPFEPDNLLREVRLSPWQRVNYWVGFMASQSESDCGGPSGPIVNPLEWAIASRSLIWFLDRWPQYADEASLGSVTRVFGAGLRSLGGLATLRRCATPASPLLGGFAGYRTALAAFGTALDATSARYREENLKVGADIDLDAPASQQTGYRPTLLEVGPCGGTPSCDMGERLEASRALFSRFPDAYLLADQIGLGEVSLCYRDVSWVDREAELPPVRSEAMARYSGRLSFVLEGRYSSLPEPVFALKLVSPDRYEYLFGANRPDVLDDPCPRHLLNSHVNAELPDRFINLVPRRLTYMTADRMHPQRVFEAHWIGGQEWRDWFVTGRGVEVIFEQDQGPVIDAVTQRLAELRGRRDNQIYEALLAGDASPLDGEVDPLVSAMQALETRKRVLEALAKLLVPTSIEHEAALRASLFGELGLFDRSGVLRSRQREESALNLAGIADARYLENVARWRTAARDFPAPGREVEATVTGTLLRLRALGERLSAASAPVPDVDRDD